MIKKEITDKIEDVLMWLLAMTACVLPFWLIYKICAGIFFLLNKLIDKI